MLEKYRCKRPFTYNGHKIEQNSTWDYSSAYVSSMKNGVRIYMSDNGSDDNPKTYLDIPNKIFNSYFERIS